MKMKLYSNGAEMFALFFVYLGKKQHIHHPPIMSIFCPVTTIVVVIVYHPYEFIIRLAVRRKQTLLTPAPVTGTAVAQRDFFTVSFYFYCVMTQSEAHNVDQAWWPGVYVCVREGENNRLCVCVCGEKKKE